MTTSTEIFELTMTTTTVLTLVSPLGGSGVDSFVDRLLSMPEVQICTPPKPSNPKRSKPQTLNCRASHDASISMTELLGLVDLALSNDAVDLKQLQ